MSRIFLLTFAHLFDMMILQGGKRVKNRLKALRKELGLTQEKFAERLSMKRNSIANYEIGRNEPIDAVIALICREFSVNEEWLRTGDGEMFRENPMKKENGYYIEELLEDYGDNPFYDMIIDMMKTYCELDEKSKLVIRDSVKKLKDNMKARDSKSSHASQDT